MKEFSYNSILTGKLLAENGGRVIKIADKATLGLPDSLYVKDSIATFIECKMGHTSSLILRDGKVHVRLWDCINDRRQFEVCRLLSKNATVLYCIYWSRACISAVVPLEILELFRDNRNLLREGKYLALGHGSERVIRIIEERRKRLYERLKFNFAGEIERISPEVRSLHSREAETGSSSSEEIKDGSD